MADIEKAIDAEDQIDLDVENQDKSIKVSLPEDSDIDLASFETLEDGTISFGSVLTPDIQEEFNANLAELIDEDELIGIYNDLIDAVDGDKSSRQNWEDTYKEGLEK